MSVSGTPTPAHRAAGIFLLSAATLLLELSLTRVLSVSQWYHFGFLVISTALLGFGAAGVSLAILPRLRRTMAMDAALARLGGLFGVATVVSFWLMQRIPFDPFNLLTDPSQWISMPMYYLVLALPFYFAGLALALLLSRAGESTGTLYAFDLIGAGVGCAAIALVMPPLGGGGSVILAAALGMGAGAIFATRQARGLAALLTIGALGIALLAWQAQALIPLRITSLKFHRPVEPMYTAWNTFSRIDVFQRRPAPGQAESSERVMFFDAGTAATGLPDLRPDVRSFLRAHPEDKRYDSGVAYLRVAAPKVLIIGSGGGQQVLDALHFGAGDITAVEINPIINRIASNLMDDYAGHLFRQPEVKLVTEEGRSYVRRSRERYDAIISVHTISNAAVASGALSLAENYVLTREAFADYLAHLTDQGVIYFTRPQSQIPRLMATAREALHDAHIANAGAHLYAFRFPPSEDDIKTFGARPAFVAGLLVSRQPFTAADVALMEQRLGVGQPPRTPGEPAPEALYSPVAPMVDSLYAHIARDADLQAVYAGQPREISPATDDRPFFNHQTRWTSLCPATLHSLLSGLPTGSLIFDDRPVAEATLIGLLVQVTLVALLAILLPLRRLNASQVATTSRWQWLIYFGSLGLGFIAVEIALLSRYSLFLGQPVYTLAVVLASLLAWTGIGAFLSGRFALPPAKILRIALSALLGALLLTAVALPAIFQAALGWSFPARLVLSVLTLAPLGLLLGMPFPLGLRLASREGDAVVAWCWGINGFATVFGTVLATMCGMTWGFRAVLVLSALCYLTALVTRKFITPRFTSNVKTFP